MDDSAYTWMSLTPDIDKVVQWLEIREEGGLDIPHSIHLLKICMHKSSLLKRLLDGKEPLLIPPPTKFSYPWYSLIENKKGIASDVWKADGISAEFTEYPALYVDQLPWKIIEEINSNEYLITYPYNFRKSSGQMGTKFAPDVWKIIKEPAGDWFIIKIS